MDGFSFVSDIGFRGLKSPESALDCSAGSPHFPSSGHMQDIGDYKKFGFIIQAGALVHALTFQVKQATDVNEGDIKDVDGAVVDFTASEDNSYKIIEVSADQLDINNDFQFISLEVTGGSTNDFGMIQIFKLNPGERPVVQDGASANGYGWFADATIV